jgi:hypothetical protein
MQSTTDPSTKPVSILETILHEPQSLPTLGAAAAVCDHPQGVIVPLDERIALRAAHGAPDVWCALCGALGTGTADASRDWTRPTIAQIITREQIQDFQSLAFGLAEVAIAIDRIKPEVQSAAVCDVLRLAIRELLASPALAGGEQIAAALKALGQ